MNTSPSDTPQSEDMTETDPSLGAIDTDMSMLQSQNIDPEEEDEGVAAYNLLIDGSKISYERLPMLEVVLDRYTRRLSTTLRNFIRSNLEVEIKEINSVRFGAYIEGFPLTSIIGVFKIEGWSPSAILTMNGNFIGIIIDCLLGGRKNTAIIRPENKPYTAIEQELVRRMIKVVLDDFEKSFAIIHESTFELESLETNPAFASIVRGRDAALLVRVLVNVEGRKGEFDFVIPYETLEPGREKLLQTFSTDNTEKETKWKTHLQEELKRANVNLRVELTQFESSLKGMLSWQEGTLIPLDVKPDTLVNLYCGDRLILTGKVGRKHHHVAVQVEDTYLTASLLDPGSRDNILESLE